MKMSPFKLIQAFRMPHIRMRRIWIGSMCIISVLLCLAFGFIISWGTPPQQALHVPWEGCAFNLTSWLRNNLQAQFRRSVSYLATDFVASGLGNSLFQYASLYGIARLNMRIPVISKTFQLREVFHLAALCTVEERPGVNWGKVVEWKSSSMEKRLLHFEKSSPDLELIGFFQSWKYFHSVSQEIREQFKFQDHIKNKAVTFLNDVTARADMSGGEPTYIGVHVRRGDMLEGRFIQHGYTVADKDYLQRAMEHFESKYSRIIFIISSDDLSWCKDNIERADRIMFFSEEHSAELDLAILSACNHTIMTVGTFGWWAAWLAGGDVIYYKDFPKRNSRLSGMFSKDKLDYFYPHWKGM